VIQLCDKTSHQNKSQYHRIANRQKENGKTGQSKEETNEQEGKAEGFGLESTGKIVKLELAQTKNHIQL
jgi:hypothetical protein